MKIIGIDDAGRGPVLGPMILAGVLIDSDNENKIIKHMGAKDSKLLLPKRRKEISEKIKSKYSHHIEITNPPEIDNHKNLNWLEAEKAAMIVNKLTQNLDEKVKVIVDCPSTNINSWASYLHNLLIKKEQIELFCEHKADSNHPVVSAASIIAKEMREDKIHELKLKHEIDFGSGYPSDPKTKDFIRENFSNPLYKGLIRFSWKTTKKLFEGDKQKSLF